MQVQQFEVVDHLGHTGLHLGLVQEILMRQTINRGGDLLVAGLIPWETTLVSILKIVKKRIYELTCEGN